MFKFRVTNLGTAGMSGNRAALEFSAENTELCALVWDVARNVEEGQNGPTEHLVHYVLNGLLSEFPNIPGTQDALDLMVSKKQIVLERRGNSEIISPKAQGRPITFCEKVDQHNIVDEFLTVAKAERVGDAVIAWMLAQWDYTDIQLLKMHTIINCTMVANVEMALALLNKGDSSAEQVPYLYEFSDEDAIFVQEWSDKLMPVAEAGASESFAENSTTITNELEEDNVVACIGPSNSLDLTNDTLKEMKAVVTPHELGCKPFRFTSTYHPGARGSKQPNVAVVNWHAKCTKTSFYEHTFASITTKMFEAVEKALENNQILDEACVLIVADSNLQTLQSAKDAADVLKKSGYIMFNHSEMVDVTGKGKDGLQTPRNVLKCNVNRGRRYSNMSVQWEKARDTSPPTAAAKGVVIARANSNYNVLATCKERSTPCTHYKLDHGHFEVTVQRKTNRYEVYVALILFFFIVVAFLAI